MLLRHPLLLLTCVISFLLPSGAHASGYTDFWLYGSALHNFYDDGTRDITSVTLDGASSFSISDENGKPLFFGSGKTVFKYKEDGAHQLLTNDLDSSDSIVQSAAFLPDSNSSNIVHLIYISSNGLKYATLDYSKEKVEDIWVEKDISIADTHQSRSITLAGHANNKDVWVISMLEETVNRHAFEGVLFDGTTFTKQRIDDTTSGIWGKINFIKISPDGKKLIFCSNDKISGSPGTRIRYGLYDFENDTGDISHDTYHSVYTGDRDSDAGGISFSADGKYLYISAGTASGTPNFYQVALQTETSYSPSMNVTLPEGYSSASIGGGQLAPDGNIYYSCGIPNYELIIKNPDKAYNGKESGAHVVFQYNPTMGDPRAGTPLFNQSLLFKEPLTIKQDNSNLQLDIDSTRLPEGTLQNYGICWSDSGTPTIEDDKLSATSSSAPPVWNMNDYLTEGTQYIIRSFATIDGSTYYYDERKITLSPPPSVDISGTPTVAIAGETVSLVVNPVADCKYKWEQVSGPDITILNATAANATFVMPASDVSIKITARIADNSNIKTTKTIVIKRDISPVAQAGPDQNVVEGTTVTLSASGSSHPTGADLTFEWTQTAGPTVPLTKQSVYDWTFVAPKTPDASGPLTFQLKVTAPDGKSDTDFVTINVKNANKPPLLAPLMLLLN